MTGTLGLVTLANPGFETTPAPGDGFLSEFFSFDREIQKFMRERNIPGSALAVVKDGRLVYTRGYGWADREARTSVIPTSLFRIASITKSFTAVAVLQLVERRKLDLEARAFEMLKIQPAAGSKTDPRLKQITIRQLLHHTGGWDRDKSFDPMFRAREIAGTLGIQSPPSPRAIISYMLGQPLDFDPGKRYAYSNFGYCVLGRIIEQVSGRSYEQFVHENVLVPVDIKTMRPGRSLEPERAEGEVRYYMPHDEMTEGVFDRLARQKVSWPYGGFCLESMDSHGGWIASAVDLARFAAALHDPRDCPLLKFETIRTMYEPPAPPVWRNDDGSLKDYYYGCGWLVRPAGKEDRANYWHNGSLPGTYTLLVRRHDGVSWVVLFNQRSDDDKLPDGEIDPALHRAANAVHQWPKFDLFQQYQ